MAVPCSNYRWEIWSVLPTKYLLLLWVYRRQHKNIHQDILKKICVQFSKTVRKIETANAIFWIYHGSTA